jgi:hypothetical protein
LAERFVASLQEIVGSLRPEATPPASAKGGVVLRITRHPCDFAREAALKAAFGDDMVIVTNDAHYNDDIVGTVSALIKSVEAETGRRVVAVEATAPFPLLKELVRRKAEISAVLLRAEFQKEPGTQRNVVVGKEPNGRDIFAFGHYVKISGIEDGEFVTRPLTIQ